MMKKNVFLLTGVPGVGKTTALGAIVNLLGKDKCGGFLAMEIRGENSSRVGFQSVPIGGSVDEGDGVVIAHASLADKSEIVVGGVECRYGVDLAGFEKGCIDSIYDAIRNKEYVVIDEIGPMQLRSPKFIEAVEMAADSQKILVGTVVYEKDNSGYDELCDTIKKWLAEFKAKENVELMLITKDKRPIFKSPDKLSEYLTAHGLST